jgi:glycosyltransferase involved in cell wall biosynthesis
MKKPDRHNSPRQKIVLMCVTNDLVSDNRVHKMALSLMEMGFLVQLIGRKLKHSPTINDRPYSTHRFKLTFTKSALFYANYNLRLFIYLLFARFDVVVSNDLDTLLACYWASRLKRKPIVYDSHEYFTEVPELVNRPKVKQVWEKIEKSIVPKLTNCITVGQSIADIYEKKYGVKFNVIRNLSNRQPGEENAGEASPPFPTDKPVILYQGAVNLGRGIEEAILAMKQIDFARLVIIGDGDKLDACKELAMQNHLETKVIFTGRIPLRELCHFTPYATIGLSIEKDMGLNYRFALPNKLFDYIQAGVPVLASSLPEIKGIVERYETGMVIDEISPESIVKGITTMINSPGQMERWKENARKASVILCWEEQEHLLNSIYTHFL